VGRLGDNLTCHQKYLKFVSLSVMSEVPSLNWFQVCYKLCYLNLLSGLILLSFHAESILNCSPSTSDGGSLHPRKLL